MKAQIRTTNNYDSVDNMMEDLTRDLPPEKIQGRLALLFCLPDIPYEELYARLCRKLPLTIAGGVTFYLPFTSADDDCNSVLAILPARTKFATMLSPILDQAESGEQMAALHRDCLAELGETPEMFICLMPNAPEILQGRYAPELFGVIGETPCFGGAVSGLLGYGGGELLAEGRAHQNRVFLAALTGGLRPVFSISWQVTKFSEYIPTVTEADHNIVKRVDGDTFFDYLRRLNCDPLDPLLLSGYPICILTGGSPANGGLHYARALVRLDEREESGIFSSPVPVGSNISLAFMPPENVEQSLRECLDSLKSQMAAGHDYSLLLYAECASRHYAKAGRTSRAAEYLRGNLPPGLLTAGFYGDNEFGPSDAPFATQTFNHIYNYSLVMCAL